MIVSKTILKTGYPKFKKRNNRQSAHYMSNAFKYCEETRAVKLAKMSEHLKIKCEAAFLINDGQFLVIKQSDLFDGFEILLKEKLGKYKEIGFYSQKELFN